MTRKLRAPKGTDEANVDGVLYRVDNDGTIDVPDAAAPSLLHTGGFVAIDEMPAPVPIGHVILRAPQGSAACAWNGLTYAVDADGRVAVPAPAAAILYSHGFVPDQPGKSADFSGDADMLSCP
jgi:hypothetical protein